jgi:hypothetical protein
MMEPSDVRKRVLQTIDQARRRVAAHREQADRAGQRFEELLPDIAAVWKIVANVLRSEGHPFTLQTPAGVVRLVSDRSSDHFIELALDTARRPAAVVVRTRFSRGREVVDRESVVVESQLIMTLNEEVALNVLLEELERFVER